MPDFGRKTDFFLKLSNFLDDWSDLKQQIKSGLNIDRGPIIHTAIQQKRFEIAENLIKHG